MKKLFLIAITFALLAGCSNQSAIKDDIEPKKIVLTEEKIAPENIVIAEEMNPENIEQERIELEKENTKIIYLKMSLEEKNKRDSSSSNIRVGSYKNDNIYLSFDNAIEGNESLENFKKYLQLEKTVISIYLPGKATNGAKSVPNISKSDSSVRENMEVSFTSYEKGWLKGTLKTKAKKASYWIRDNEDSNCITDDMMGICVKNISIDMDIIVNFEVQVIEILTPA